MLIADDVADTGHTLALVKEFCTGKVAEVRCAVLYEKPRSVVQCEYVWRATDRWIKFPWSDQEPIAVRQGWPPSRTPEQRRSDRTRCHRERMTRAALRPLAPHTPAPGNVAAPVR